MNSMRQCPFCNTTDPFLKNDLAYAVFDLNPVNKGHLLILPFRHVEHYFLATTAERIAILDLMDKAKDKLDREFHPDGYNIGINVGEAAGQTVMHLHVHLIPRYKGDIENPRGGVRGVIPEKRIY